MSNSRTGCKFCFVGSLCRGGSFGRDLKMRVNSGIPYGIAIAEMEGRVTGMDSGAD